LVDASGLFKPFVEYIKVIVVSYLRHPYHLLARD
jgi:hypothetical protein